MANIEGMIDSMGISFFCNVMVESLYYFRKDGLITETLEMNCKRAITEFESLKWPREKTYPDMEDDLFNSNQNIHTFEEVCSYYEKCWTAY